MSQFINLPNDENHDYGGVHLNSTIIAHAFYLLAEGLDGAIGLGDAEKIFYHCLVEHLQPQSQFIDTRLGCIASATALFGADSIQARKVAEAFDAVEINAAPSTPPPSPIPTVQGEDSTLFVYFDLDYLDYFLGRRETAQGDKQYGVMLAGPVRVSRPAVLGDGSIALFVDSAYDLGAVDTKTGQEIRIGLYLDGRDEPRRCGCSCHLHGSGDQRPGLAVLSDQIGALSPITVVVALAPRAAAYSGCCATKASASRTSWVIRAQFLSATSLRSSIHEPPTAATMGKAA